MKKLLLSLLILFTYSNAKSQSWWWTLEEMANMPIAISNNAVVEGWANDTGYVYSFGGIDSTKIWSGINKKSFRYNTVTDVWDTIPDLPNLNSVIAAGASYVDSIVYIIGGYQVLSNGNEISSNVVNRFDPRTNTYLTDGANIPTPIDDHVQAVYNDSLIYIITGWSNSGNVPNVQIYDPENDNWLTGTSVPNNNSFKVFGASGTIIDNTIYYHGGASTGFNFPAQNNLRIGTISASDPTQITWNVTSSSYFNYRSISFRGPNYTPHFIGGSDISYNYNGISYNGSGGVSPNQRAIKYFNSIVDTTLIDRILGAKLPMDLRGAGSFRNNFPFWGSAWFIAGGMEENQQVSNKTLRLIYTINVSGIDEDPIIHFSMYPNPTLGEINLVFEKVEKRTIRLIDVLGNEVFKIENNEQSSQLLVSNYPNGIYFVKVETDKGTSSQKIIVQ